jgi:hypothetical protein
VAALVVWPDRVPPPVIVHETPAAFLSFVTEAVKLTVSVASTVVADALTDTLGGVELPPQPAR